MKTDRPIRVGVFRDGEKARRVVQELRADGFTRLTVVSDDPNLRQSLRDTCSVRDRSCAGDIHRSPGQISYRSALAGAGIGLVAGFVGVFLFNRSYGPPGAIMNVAIPLAGLVWGAFIGAMVSRGWQREPENFFDQELEEGEVLVAIEDEDYGRLMRAEQILRGQGVQVMPLPAG